MAMKDDTNTSTVALRASDGAFDPLEDGVRQRVCCFIDAILEEELERLRLGADVVSAPATVPGATFERQVIGTFGAETVKVPRARLVDDAGQARERHISL